MGTTRSKIIFTVSKFTAIIFTGVILVVGFFSLVNINSQHVNAAPIDPPEGYPKFIASTKTVSPTLVGVGNETLTYRVELVNTGAYRADDTEFIDFLPAGTSYNDDAEVSSGPAPTYSAGDHTLRWTGDVGFDETVVISFSVDIDNSEFSGYIENTAEIDHPMISEPVILTAEALVTDEPLLSIEKTSEPDLPGPNNPMTYTLTVVNHGQDGTGLELTVTDDVPDGVTYVSGGNESGGTVTWERIVDLETGASTVFTYTVDVNDVPSGTVITNDNYQVEGTGLDLTVGEVHTTTVTDPILSIYKQIWPDPPGSNREAIYTLTVFNKGSMATDLVVTDEVPDEVTYVSGGDDYSNGVVTWNLPKLKTMETARFTYTVYVGDVISVSVPNESYQVCSAGDNCAYGSTLTSLVQGAQFEAEVYLDPIAKKPGGGTGPVTPTLILRNLGPGNALDASALLYFKRISVSANDLYADPDIGTFPTMDNDCGEKCVYYQWIGDLSAGEVITFTTIEGQSTIGGGEGTNYTATITISDTLTNGSTPPITATAVGTITHYANLIPVKTAPEYIGRGQLMTYTFSVRNSGLSTDEPPQPILTDTVPLSVTFVSATDGGELQSEGGVEIVSWELPAMSPGDVLKRSYVVQVDDDLISGTQIINDNYRTYWFDVAEDLELFLSNTGPPITTTVRDVGLVDSYKEVTPSYALPDVGTVLTYYLHIVNSSPFPLDNVNVYDWLPWEHTTYQRDVIASSGTVDDDIVSIDWTGDVAAESSEVLTFTVVVDPYFKGVLTNTVVIDHPSLLEPVEVTANAYITDEPVLEIFKTASPDPVEVGTDLEYRIHVSNLAQPATNLVVTDLIPEGTSYVPGSATAGGQLIDDLVVWEFPILHPLETRNLAFKVRVGFLREITNAEYEITSAEGVSAQGPPVTTPTFGHWWFFFPLIFK